ncbi:hypothetical protein ScPMuIL_000511 [Solemya velum]
MASPTGDAANSTEFLYLPPPDDDPGAMYREEGVREKFIRKTKENPAVLVGVAATTYALSYGLWQMKTGNRWKSQKMMRLRIAAQGFTVAALLAGVAFSAKKKMDKS